MGEEKKVAQAIIDTDQKALTLNLNNRVYGTFAEIGAGQEVARHFFKVGAAAGTIIKTMSAYDKTFSDRIYGEEFKNRYVCESRVYKMLDHEYDLVIDRLGDSEEERTFFVFADTVAAINYARTIKGNGWLGVRFQLTPNSEPNDLVIHVKMKDQDNLQQQAAIGILGVNMIYACFYLNHDPEAFVKSLLDNLRGRIEIDMIRLEGPNFKFFDNRLLSLYAVKYGLSEVCLFGPDKRSMHASEFLYKKSLMVVRGHFRPPTIVTQDVIHHSFEQFKAQNQVDPDRASMMLELTLNNLERENGEILEQDFLARADCIAALGHTVILSDCSDHQRLVNYLKDYKLKHIGLVIGIRELKQLIEEKYDTHHDGALLTTFGRLFTKNIKVYAYPALEDDMKTLMTLDNLSLPEGINFLFKFLLNQDLIVGVEQYDESSLNIMPANIFKDMQADNGDWEKCLPAEVVDIIKEKELFGVKN